MTLPKAYAPFPGQRYQILTRYVPDGGEWEHCDYAKDEQECNYLLNEYRLAYNGNGHADFRFKVIELPQKFWPKKGNTL